MIMTETFKEEKILLNKWREKNKKILNKSINILIKPRKSRRNTQTGVGNSSRVEN